MVLILHFSVPLTKLHSLRAPNRRACYGKAKCTFRACIHQCCVKELATRQAVL